MVHNSHINSNDRKINTKKRFLPALQRNEVLRAVSDAETGAFVAAARAVTAARAAGPSVLAPLQTKGAAAQ